MSRKLPGVVVLTVVLGLFAGRAAGRNVDLSTVPARDTVQLTIYNSEDITLVRETRKVTFKPGANPLQFSWAGTLIDSTSVELTFLTDPDKLDVLDTTFPHDKPEMLYWNVQSELDGEATIEITYFTSGITWSADYVCVTDQEEESVELEGFVRVTNNSGEEYEDAQVRLVVGKINLVEKIAQLARVSMNEVDRLEKNARAKYKHEAAKEVMDGRMGGLAFGSKPGSSRPKEIVKEGLSEYFIYTIEGTESIPSGWSKRLRSVQAGEVPLKVEYRYREYRERPLSEAEIRAVLKKLGARARDVLRTRDRVFTELGLSGDEPERELIARMAQHPTLLQRPIGIKGKRAVLGRPPEALLEL